MKLGFTVTGLLTRRQKTKATYHYVLACAQRLPCFCTPCIVTQFPPPLHLYCLYVVLRVGYILAFANGHEPLFRFLWYGISFYVTSSKRALLNNFIQECGFVFSHTRILHHCAFKTDRRA